MKDIFESSGKGLRDLVWRGVTEDVRRSGERVLFERGDSSSEAAARPESSDRHGLARNEVFVDSSLAGFSSVVGVFCITIALTSPDVGEKVIFALAALGCVVGTALAAIWTYRARKARCADSRRRRYLLTDERLIVVGVDTFIEASVSEISWVRLKNHRNGRGTVVCGYHDGITKKVIAIEDVEGAGRIKELLEERLAAIRGRLLRESLTASAG